MALIQVTASVKYTYDTEDGLVGTHEEAIQDVVDILDHGIDAYQYSYDVKEV